MDSGKTPHYPPIMKPADIQQIGAELAIRWDDGVETYLPLDVLRRHCPCAGCKGEMDVMGNVYRMPEKELSPLAFQLKHVSRIGSYAIQPTWADGHASGIFSFEYLRKIAERPK